MSYMHPVLAEILGGPDMLIVFAIVLLLFGGSKLPELARSLGKAKREFEDGSNAKPDSDTTDTTAKS
jgi:sec-independent protein translocase protein TatA